MEHEFKSRGIDCKRQIELKIKYKNNPIGNYRVDYLIEDKVIVDLKCIDAIENIHITQVLTFLKAGILRVRLLNDFNADKLKQGIKRVRL